jgi:hypothetical protein
VEFEKEDADYKPGPFVAVDERMVADYTRRVQGGHGDNVGFAAVSMVLAGPSKRGL